jgi:hypothetical protein
MTISPAGRGSDLATACLTGVLILVDAGLAALGLLVWDGRQRGDLTGPEAATFILLGASAAAGAVLLLLALVALARGGHGYGLARFAAGLAWLRVATVVLTVVAIAVARGLPTFAGLLPAVGASVAVFDAVMALVVAGVAVRRTRDR